jgi:membrane dipeptidase
VAEARRIVSQGKVAAFIGLEGGYPIQGDPARLELLFEVGVRYMTLTWNHSTSWADASGDEPQHGGLTATGRQVVREMNRLGMVVDVSHASDETFWDVLETTRAPIIASHSNARALCDHPRNLSDRMLRALAENDGVVGVSFVPGFLEQTYSAEARRRIAAIQPELERLDRDCRQAPGPCRKQRRRIYRRALAGLPPVSISRVLDHIDHVVQVAGVDHVGLGSDFDGFSVTPEGLEDVSRLPRITAGLLARGYSEEDVRKILGRNFMRVFQHARATVQ